MKGGVHLSIVPKLNVSGIKGLRLFFQGKTNVNEYAIVCILDIFNTRVRDKKRLEKVGNLVKNSYLYR